MFFSAKKATPEEGKSNSKKSQAAANKERERLILSKKLDILEKSVLPPSTVEDTSSPKLTVQHVADDSSDDECWTAEEVEEIMPKSKSDNTTRVLQHPHFGGKTPKQHSPPKCISVLCKEEKEIKDEEISQLREEIIKLKEELRKYCIKKRFLKTPIKSKLSHEWFDLPKNFRLHHILSFNECCR